MICESREAKRLQISNNRYLSIEQIQDQFLNKKKADPSNAVSKDGTSFQSVLEQKQNTETKETELKFSKHAAARLSDRNITLSDNQLNRLNEAATKASEKGIRETLVLVDSLAFIVNVPNQTVVTALDHTQAEENIYTNIDGAVII